MQFDSNGRLRHLITLEGLSRDTLLQLLDCAAQNCALGVDPMGKRNVLAGMAVCTLFLNHPRVPVIHSTWPRSCGNGCIKFRCFDVVYEQG